MNADGVNSRAALNYAEHGYLVFPCRVRDKKPLTEHGFHDATTERKKILDWWLQDPHANVAIATGAKSDLVVLDVDPRNGGDISLEMLEAKHEHLPETVESLTGGGGQQFLFQYPAGHDVRSSTGALAPGIDIKANGGYVIVPPSIHPSGKRYEWEVTHALGDFPLVPLPLWLLTLITSQERLSIRPAPGLISNGTVHYTFVSWAGTMHRRGMSPGAILAALLHENQTRCDPVRPEANIRKIVEDITTRYAPGTVPPAWEIMARQSVNVKEDEDVALAILQRAKGGL